MTTNMTTSSFLGQISTYKGCLLLIETAAQLQPVCLVIIPGFPATLYTKPTFPPMEAN